MAENSEKESASIPVANSPFGGWEHAALRGFIVVVAVVLAWLTWTRWGDFQIDCGREIYVPTEILRGKLLYRDLFYPYGPLAPYLSALLILIFGPHLVVFYLLGIVVAIGCALLLFELGTMLAGRAVGLTAAVALLLIGFGPGIFNYVFPYSYGATIGLMLSLWCAWFTLRSLVTLKSYNQLMAGLVASLALLCKQEFGAASYAMIAFVLVIDTILQRSLRPLIRGIAACGPGVALWVAIYGWVFWILTPSYMLEANWIGMPGTYSTPTAAHLQHLYAVAGQRFIPGEMVTLALLAALCLALWFLLAKMDRGPRNVSLAILVAISVAARFGSSNLGAGALTSILVFPRGMYLVGCGFVAYALYRLYHDADRRHLGEAAFGIFALVPALRVFADIRQSGYSIYYAIPLFLVFLVTISRVVQAATPARSIDERREAVNYLLFVEVVMLAFICLPPSAQRLARLDTSWGVLHLESEDANVARQILTFISDQKRDGRQVAVLPEAAILYALTGTHAPSRWYTVLPGFLSPGQEEAYLADLNRAAPDYILLTNRASPEYGADYFGIDYGQKTYHWIEANYRLAGEFGSFRRDNRSSTLAALLYERIRLAHRN